MKKGNSYQSPELEAFLAIPETIDTESIRVSMLLAAQIADAMKLKGIGKKQLAELLGKKPSMVTRWLSGTHNFEINTLVQIAKVLNIQFFAFDNPARTDLPMQQSNISLNINVLHPVRVPNDDLNAFLQKALLPMMDWIKVQQIAS
jgi:transcriptional regulator with XRE-family HTH domain